MPASMSVVSLGVALLVLGAKHGTNAGKPQRVKINKREFPESALLIEVFRATTQPGQRPTPLISPHQPPPVGGLPKRGA